uniref:Uncharacterized protein n=1 Tax=Arundo donax TaxID=35708 RepID=A0A0A9HQ29_ARUDO
MKATRRLCTRCSNIMLPQRD